MTSVALAAGLFAAAVGIAGIVAPYALQTIARYSITPLGLYVAAAVRVVFGVILIRAASASRAPAVLRVVGIVALVAGLITAFLGVDRAHAMFEWWSAQGPVLIRLWPALALIFGILIVYAVNPARRVT